MDEGLAPYVADPASRRGNSAVDDASNYGYAPKSKLLYGGKRSKTGMKNSNKFK